MGDYFSNSSATAPIGLKKRPDIVIQPLNYQGEPYWVCKDPLGQEYQHLNEQEYALLDWLDGEVTFDQLKHRFERKFSPYRVEHRELAQAIGDLHEKSLVIATDASQGEKLLEMGREKFRKELKQKMLSIWAIKWKGFDPETFLNITNPYVRWFFSRRMVAVVLLMALAASSWLLLHYEQAMSRMPSLWSFVDPSNWLTLGCVIAVTKLVHEFGHAYAFKRFGGEVHEIGVMIFFFMPTMYCNTSDSWLLEDKWKRIAVALGGIYLEIAIFSAATFVWWFSGPGTVQTIAINLMFICSLSAVIVNGNPLLKYDGYFVLSDLLEIPNLSKQSEDQIRRKFMVHALGIRDEEALWISNHNKRLMIGYGIAAYLFRLSLMLTVAYMLVINFAPYGLAPLGAIFASVVTIVYLCTPLYKLIKRLKTPGTMIKTKRKNIVMTMCVVGVIVVGLFIPFPYYLSTDCTMDSGIAKSVYVRESGTLAEIFFRPGEVVTKGQVILRLENPSLEKDFARVRQELALVQVEIENIRLELFDQNNKSGLQSLMDHSHSLELQLEKLSQRIESLNVRAVSSGMLVGVSMISKTSTLEDERNLREPTGNLLIANSDRPWLKAGLEVCRIRPVDDKRAALSIKQQDQDLVQVGQMVYLMFRSNPSIRYQSQVDSLSFETENLDDLVDFEAIGDTVKSLVELKQTQAKAGKTVNKDGGALESSVLLAICSVEHTDSLIFGAGGTAKIHVGSRSLVWRLSRMIRLFVNSKL